MCIKRVKYSEGPLVCVGDDFDIDFGAEFGAKFGVDFGADFGVFSRKRPAWPGVLL